MRPWVASSASAAAWSFACLAFAWTVAKAAFWSRSWLCSLTFKVV